MNSQTSRSLLLALLLSFCWCASVVAEPAGGAITHGEIEQHQVPERFRFDSQPVRWQQSEVKEFELYDFYKVTFPSPVKTELEANNTVHCEYFRPKGEGVFPAVIVLHILGGDFELSRVCCRTLAANKIAALFLKMPHYGPRSESGSREEMISAIPDKTVANMTQAVKDIRRGADWLSGREEVDASRLGITGISLGGIVASLAASVEPRFQKGCFLLAGADLSTLVAKSSEMDEVRAAWQGRDVTADQVAEMLRPIDPLSYAARLRDRDVLMINARQDKVVPRECTEALWQAAGHPQLIWWNAGHYSAAVYLPSGLSQMARFFGRPAAQRR